MTLPRFILQGVLLLGYLLSLVSLGCILTAKILGSERKGRFAVWIRGSFQREQDYTPWGWRLYEAGRFLALVSILQILIAIMLGA